MFRGKVPLVVPEILDLVELVVPLVLVIQETAATEVAAAAAAARIARKMGNFRPTFGKLRPEETLHLVQAPAELRGRAASTKPSTPVLPEMAEVEEVLVLLIPVVQGIREVPETAEALVLQLQHWV
jgi:hypothetical protein